MTSFDDIERAREMNEGTDYDRVRTTYARNCACGHDESEHDEDGVCQIRRCECPELLVLR